MATPRMRRARDQRHQQGSTRPPLPAWPDMLKLDWDQILGLAQHYRVPVEARHRMQILADLNEIRKGL